MSAALALSGRVALVTGGHKRLGRAIALALGAQGATVAVHYRRDADQAAEVVARIAALGGTAIALAAELTAPAQVAELVADLGARLGRLDLVVAAAASYEPTPVASLGAADLDRVLAGNARAPIDLVLRCRTLLDASGDGRAIVLGDLAGVTPFSGYLAHSMAKAALHAGVRGLAAELAPGIVVNALVPGAILRPEAMADSEWRRLQARVPMGFLACDDGAGAVAAIVDAVLFFASASRYITGSMLVVDGGRTARW